MEHVGVGQDVFAVLASPVALVVRRVSVVSGDPDPETEIGHRRELVLGQGLGGTDVESGGPTLTARTTSFAFATRAIAAGSSMPHSPTSGVACGIPLP